jgi:asparagine synthase (glutamine-hydrolysing)
MCGAVGIVGHRVDCDSLQRGVQVLHHRGPDDSGIYMDEDHSVGLGHARLAIIDLTGGRQPLTDQAGDLVR